MFYKRLKIFSRLSGMGGLRVVELRPKLSYRYCESCHIVFPATESAAIEYGTKRLMSD
jgi:hypothetical protein